MIRFKLSDKINPLYIQCRHLIPAPVNPMSTSAWLYKHAGITCQRNKPSTSMTLIHCESKLHSVVRSSMYPCLGNWVVISHAVMHYAQAAHTFSAGIICQHCKTNPLHKIPGSASDICDDYHFWLKVLNVDIFAKNCCFILLVLRKTGEVVLPLLKGIPLI